MSWKTRKIGTARQRGKKFLVRKGDVVEYKEKKVTLFDQRKYGKYADIISVESKEKAEKALSKLWNEYEDARTDAKKERIRKVTQMAANVAGVMARNKNLKLDTRREKREIAEMYRKQAKRYGGVGSHDHVMEVTEKATKGLTAFVVHATIYEKIKEKTGKPRQQFIE